MAFLRDNPAKIQAGSLLLSRVLLLCEPWTSFLSPCFPSSSAVKNPPAMQEPQKAWFWSLDWEDSLEQRMATHPNILAWRIPMDRRSWHATVHGIAKSQTQLKQLSARGTKPGKEFLLWYSASFFLASAKLYMQISWGETYANVRSGSLACVSLFLGPGSFSPACIGYLEHQSSLLSPMSFPKALLAFLHFITIK